MKKSVLVIIVILIIFCFPIALGQTNQCQSDTDSNSFWMNVLGGVFAAAAWMLINCFWQWFRQRQLRLFFGNDLQEGGYNLVYGSFALIKIFDENGKPIITHPYYKSGRDSSEDSFRISIDNPISGGDFRAIRYIASIFGRGGQIFPSLVSDTEIDEKLDISLVAVGGPYSNYKTEDILSFPENHLITMTDRKIFNPDSPNFGFEMSSGYDYGVIFRLCPKQYLGRVWIVCAGLGEWGTSGAAWYVANRWKNLVRENRRWCNFLKVPNFAAIIRVRPGQDESATPIAYFSEK